MALVRPNTFTTATHPAADDYLGIDGTVNGTRKLLADRSQTTFERHGAVGDGSTNDAAAMQTALQYAADNGVKIVGRPGAVYRIASAVTVTRAGTKPLVIDWNGAEIHCDGAGITIGESLATALSTSLAANVERYDNKILLASTTGIEVGDLLEILSPALTQGAITVHHYYIVREIDAGVGVWIEGNAVADINDQQIIDDDETGSITVKAFHTYPPVIMTNGRFRVTDTAGLLTAVRLRGHSLEFVEHCTWTGNTRNQIYSQFYGISIIDKCTFARFGYISGDQGYTNDAGHPDGYGFGYGAINARGYYALRSNIVGKYGWHAIDVVRGAMRTVVDNFEGWGNAYAVSCHEGAWHFVIQNSQFSGGAAVAGGRCAYLEIRGCKFNGIGFTHAITYGSENIEVSVDDSEFDVHTPGGNPLGSAIYNADTAETGAPRAGAMSVGFERKFSLSNLRIIGPVRVHAGFTNSATAGKLTIENVKLYNGAFFFRILPMGVSIINLDGEGFGGYAARLVTRGNSKIWLAGCNGLSSTDGGGALIQIEGDGSNDITIDQCSGDVPVLIKCANDITIKRMARCAAFSGVLVGRAGSGTVTLSLAVANIGPAAPYPDVTVTSAVGALTI